jgi:sec-independent protein translocase protein TatC
MAEEELKMSFWGHLEELRKRLVRSFVWIVIGFVVCFNFSEEILAALLWPMNAKMTLAGVFPYVVVVPNAVRQKLHYTTLIEPFWSHLKIALIAGLMLVFPLVMRELWLFFAPALHLKERRYAAYFVVFSSLFFLVGVLFCFLVMLPVAIPFLLTYKTENLIAIIKIGDYIDFVLKFLLATGLVFELPLLIVLLSRMGVVSPALLAKYRKFAFLGAFILGAILTPTPDLFNQTILSIPIYLLYELGILLARIFGKRNKTVAPEREGTS